ncbi:anthranilate synthase component I [Aquibacillus koreensis]|uniref:Anthranilate synthase component 1 n=1 Tax=Aquibacillus koreensis TaxID=279446 RepID=A0A9X3WNY0_9BACI|nr:anthranilate synthase component I [Aquibacillus koreensis]MCT2538185.1 anthranilate synthase component I [Aquibacillus koreensis]MDC3420871.1 anthranilate synthase component I [Aquibacillus koreensis]
MTTSNLNYKSIQLNGDMLTPISVFNRLNGKRKFMLESSANHGEKGRYSFIGLNPFKEIVGDAVQTTVHNLKNGEKKVEARKPLEVVKEHIPNEALDLPFAFYGGAIGYIGYDAIRQYEYIGEALEDEIDMPDVHVMMYQDVVVFDHKSQTVTVITVNLDGSRSDQDLEDNLHQLEKEIGKQEAESPSQAFDVSFEASIQKETFVEMVNKAKQHITDGDIFQVVLSQRMKASFDADPFTFYRRLRIANPSPYMFFIDFDDYIVLGASPESLIKIDGSKVVTNPIAGTRPRGKTTEEDQALAAELLSDEKELAEHKMLVDLSRNDLGRVCEIGSISIPKYMTIERYQHVMHIVSEVQGTLTKDYSGLDALISTLPAGTVSGAPKIRAMQIINNLETKKRGVYAGAVGYINMNGDLDLALAIRTMVIKGNQAYVQAGAGVVYDSDPEAEYQETLNKAKSLLEVNKHDLVNR